MTPLIITEPTDKITALKKLSTWLLDQLTEVRAKFGAMAVTGAKGEAIATTENDQAAQTVADLHAAVDGSESEFQDHLETPKPVQPTAAVVLTPEPMTTSPVHPEDAEVKPELDILPPDQVGIPVVTTPALEQPTSPSVGYPGINA